MNGRWIDKQQQRPLSRQLTGALDAESPPGGSDFSEEGLWQKLHLHGLVSVSSIPFLPPDVPFELAEPTDGQTMHQAEQRCDLSTPMRHQDAMQSILAGAT